MTLSADLNVLPAIPLGDEGPVFNEPWEAQAFALVLRLHQEGHFAWTEWAETLGAEITAAKERGDPDLGLTYYHHWLRALEAIVANKGLLTLDELSTRKEEWRTAVAHTEHGQPIDLARGKHTGAS
ncbi:MAG: nitrile hydratase accessory protein [Rhodospirillales bacterium]|nr:nitrile hydratase accessory protein [Rhodospirillales bacterium]